MNREYLVSLISGLGFDTHAGTPLKCLCQPERRFGGDCICLDRIIDAVLREVDY